MHSQNEVPMQQILISINIGELTVPVAELINLPSGSMEKKFASKGGANLIVALSQEAVDHGMDREDVKNMLDAMHKVLLVAIDTYHVLNAEQIGRGAH